MLKVLGLYHIGLQRGNLGLKHNAFFVVGLPTFKSKKAVLEAINLNFAMYRKDKITGEIFKFNKPTLEWVLQRR